MSIETPRVDQSGIGIIIPFPGVLPETPHDKSSIESLPLPLPPLPYRRHRSPLEQVGEDFVMEQARLGLTKVSHLELVVDNSGPLFRARRSLNGLRARFVGTELKPIGKPTLVAAQIEQATGDETNHVA